MDVDIGRLFTYNFQLKLLKEPIRPLVFSLTFLFGDIVETKSKKRLSVFVMLHKHFEWIYTL